MYFCTWSGTQLKIATNLQTKKTSRTTRDDVIPGIEQFKSSQMLLNFILNYAVN